jgi:hypothetical protein
VDAVPLPSSKFATAHTWAGPVASTVVMSQVKVSVPVSYVQAPSQA